MADKDLKEILSKYDYCENFHEGLAKVKRNGKFGYIDQTGKEVIPCKYDDCWNFSEGLAKVELNGWGFIDKTGKEVIPCKYHYCENFYEGLAAVELNGKWGFINKTGKEVIPCEYDDCISFHEGLAWVRLKSSCFYVDKTGREYTEQAVDFDEKTIVDEKVLANDKELKKLREDIIAVARARVDALNGEEKNFEVKIAEITKKAEKTIKNIIAQKTNYDEKIFNVKAEKEKRKSIEEIKSKAFDVLDALLVDNKGVTND